MIRDVFHDVLEISPKRYLSTLRMNRVRRELRRGDCMSVAAAVKYWGSCHMDQLTKDYRNFFGELPFDTLWGA